MTGHEIKIWMFGVAPRVALRRFIMNSAELAHGHGEALIEYCEALLRLFSEVDCTAAFEELLTWLLVVFFSVELAILLQSGNANL